MTIADRASLAGLCRLLGDPVRDFVSLAEGNAAARHTDRCMLVTASGSALRDVTEEEIVEVSVAPVLDFVRSEPTGTSSQTVRGMLQAASVPRGDAPLRPPSIETLMHAVVMDRTGATYLGHTHPTVLLGLLCSPAAPDLFREMLFPDEVVVCGTGYAFVPYASPGLALAHEVDRVLGEYAERMGCAPRAVLLQNHGMIALGSTASQVMAVTVLTVKSARVRLAALAAGAPRGLSPEEVRSLVDRPDEKFRLARLVADDRS